MRRTMRLLLPLGVLAFLVFPATALAVHNFDQHSANTSLLFQLQNPTNAINSDIAFWGNRAYYGDYDSVRVFDISNPGSPVLLGRFACHGPQNDPVVWDTGTRRLMFLAIDRTQSSPNCGSVDVDHDLPRAQGGWEGIRILDVTNPAAISQVGSVYTDCGAHTITVNPINASMIHLWVSSYPLRPGPTCGPVRGPENGRHPHHGVIQIVEVPVNNPAAAREIAEPPINYPGDPDNAFNPAEHDFPLLTLRACHDIAINVPLRLAAGACAEQIQLWRIGANGIPDTANPVWVLDDTTDTDGPGGGDVAVDFWHSATFSWDGKYVNFIDESFGSGCPTVTEIGLPPAPTRPSDTGRMFFVDVRTGQVLSRFMIPRAEDNPVANYCSAHLGNTVPSIGRYLLANAWYTGGIDVIDFTAPAAPFEIAFYDVADRGDNPATPTDEAFLGGDNWSAYWYENTPGDNDNLWLFATDGVEDPPSGGGTQVYRVAASIMDVGMRRLNPQTQEDLIRCRATLAPTRLRARQSRSVRVTVQVIPGVAFLPGQGVAGVPVRLRGPGVSVNTTTNGNGVARVGGITPTRRGTLRATVPTVPNMTGCSARAPIARAPRGLLGGGAALTGRPR
jgi:hypothetical protein